MHGVHVADLEQQSRSGRLSLTYKTSWLDDPNAVPLSLRMPLGERNFDDDVVSPFFGNLLPDSKIHRRLIGGMLDVTDDNDFSMLSGIGRECAGAISVVNQSEDDEPDHLVRPEWDVLGENRLAAIIRDLPHRPLYVKNDANFRRSLAGANDKAVVMVVGGEIALARSGTPSTHILKIDIPGLPDSIRTEHFCLRLASALGIKAPKTKVGVAEDKVYMTVARYDRRLSTFQGESRIQRLHQEDFCQALGYVPSMKYERDGGPSWKECFRLVTTATRAPENKIRLLDQAILQWLISNPDAHAKNYSLLHGSGRTDLAPIYDLNNAPVFRHHFKAVRPRLAMGVGGERDPERLTGEHWKRFAADVGIPVSIVLSRMCQLSDRLPDVASDLAKSFFQTPAWSPILDRVVDDMRERCRSVASRLDGSWQHSSDDVLAAEETSAHSFS